MFLFKMWQVVDRNTYGDNWSTAIISMLGRTGIKGSLYHFRKAFDEV